MLLLTGDKPKDIDPIGGPYKPSGGPLVSQGCLCVICADDGPVGLVRPFKHLLD